MIASALHTAADIDLIHLAFDGIFIVKHTPPPVGSEVMRRACRSVCFSDECLFARVTQKLHAQTRPGALFAKYLPIILRKCQSYDRLTTDV